MTMTMTITMTMTMKMTLKMTMRKKLRGPVKKQQFGHDFLNRQNKKEKNCLLMQLKSL